MAVPNIAAIDIDVALGKALVVLNEGVLRLIIGQGKQPYILLYHHHA